MSLDAGDHVGQETAADADAFRSISAACGCLLEAWRSGGWRRTSVTSTFWRSSMRRCPNPGPGEVTIAVRAAGMNPANYKRFAKGPANDPSALPWPIGYEVSGVIEALGPDTEIASGGGAVGDEVLAFRLAGGYAERITVPATAVFAKPPALDHPAAANLLLVGTTGRDAARDRGAGG